MGNTRSNEIQHEKLEEYSERYFAKVAARNKIKTRDMSIPSPSSSLYPTKKKSSRIRSRFQRSSHYSSSKHDHNHHQQQEQQQQEKRLSGDLLESSSSSKLNSTPEIMNVRSRTAMLERAELETTMNHNNNNNNNNISTKAQSTQKIFMKSSSSKQLQQQQQQQHGSSSLYHHRLAKPRDSPEKKQSSSSMLFSKAQAEAPISFSSNPFDDYTKSGGSGGGGGGTTTTTTTTTSSLTSLGYSPFESPPPPHPKSSLPVVNNNNTTKSIFSKHRITSQKRAFQLQKDNRAFEATLHNSMIWTEISQPCKITSVAFFQHWLAVGSERGNVTLLEIGDLNTGGNSNANLNGNGNGNNMNGSKYRVVTELLREGKVRSLDFSPNGKFLAVGGNDCTAAIIHLPTMRIVEEIEREDRVYSVRWNPEGDLLAVGGFDGMVAIVRFNVWNHGGGNENENEDKKEVEEDEEEEEEEGENDLEVQCELVTEIPRLGLVLTIGWSSNREYLAIGGSDKRAAIVNVETWEVVGEVQRPGSVQCLEWSPDGHILGVGGHDGVVAVIDIETRSIVKEVSLLNGDGSCKVTDITWSPDAAFLSVVGTNNRCAIYETKSFIMVHEIQRDEHITCVDWQRGSGKYLAIGGDDRSIAILKTGGMLSAADLNRVPDIGRTNTTDSQDDWSASQSNASTTFGDSKEELPNWIEMEKFDEERRKQEEEKKVIIHDMAFSPTSEYLAIAGNNRNVCIYDTETWSNIREFPMQHTVQSLAFSPSNEFLALGSEESTTCIISLPSFELLTTIPGITSIHCLQFSRDSSRLAIGDADGMLSIISTSDWDFLGEMDDSESPIYAMDFSQNGTFLAIGRNNALCSVHSCDSVYSNFWVPEVELIRKSAVNAVSFSKNEQFLAIGGGDWTVGVYNGNDNWALCHELKMDGWILSVEWSFDSNFLAIGGTDLSKGIVILDATTWERVEELENVNPNGVGTGEEVNCISWSDTGEYVAVAGSGGTSRIIDVETWSVKESISLQTYDIPIESENDQDQRIPNPLTSSVDEESFTDNQSSIEEQTEEQTVSSAASSTEFLLSTNDTDPDNSLTTNERPPSIPKLRKIGYSSRSEPPKFLYACAGFLPQYEHHQPESILTFFSSSVRNLQIHVSFIHNVAPSIVETIAIQEKGKPFFALCRILESATIVMEEILEDENGVSEWWESREKFNLDDEEIDLLHKWNAWWKEVDVKSPLIDVGLLTQVDMDAESGDLSYENKHGYHTFLEDEIEENQRWSFEGSIGRDSKSSMNNEFGTFFEMKSDA